MRSALRRQQVLPGRLDVGLRGRHELGLVAQGALAEGQPHRDELLLLALAAAGTTGARR